MNNTELNLNNISRVCVVDEYGRQYDRRNIQVLTQIQDRGQTLKIFIDKEKDSHYLHNFKK